MIDIAEFTGLAIAAAVAVPVLLLILPTVALRAVCAAAAIIAAANALNN